jgi:hypothetical protein
VRERQRVEGSVRKEKKYKGGVEAIYGVRRRLFDNVTDIAQYVAAQCSIA